MTRPKGVRPSGSDTRQILILKLGGSLIETGRINPILELLGSATRPIAIVPGGGAFADAVREAQKKIGFDDAVAHAMAILAMHQTALLLVAMQPRLVAVEALAEFNKVSARGDIPVWMPFRMAEKDRRIPRDWTITSDGLAARLAERLGVSSVVLLKPRRVPPQASLADLTRKGVIDPAFSEIVTRSGLDWRVLGPGDETELAVLIGAPAPAGKSRRS